MSFLAINIAAHNPGPMTGRGNNTYLLVEPGGEGALIDAGVGDPRHLAAVNRHLDAHGARLACVLVTHGHSDHVSGVPALASAFPSASFHKYPWPSEDAKYPVPWRLLSDGDMLLAGGASLTVLHTPGHSADHLVFWHDASRTALTGDLVLSGGSVMIDGERGGDLGCYLTSLERLIALTPGRLLPAHGPEIHDPSTALRHHLAHRRKREGQVIAALADGSDTVQTIGRSIYDGLDTALAPAAHATIRAHLEKLSREGRAIERDGRWTLCRT